MKKSIYLSALSISLGMLTLFSIQTVHAESNRNHRKTILSVAPADSLSKAGIVWSAVDSMRISKDKSIIFLFGKAKFNCPNFNITADEIIFNKKTKKITATNFVITDNLSKKEIKGTYGKFNLNN